MNSFSTTIPITIITGFLGSGKTTLLSALLKQETMVNAAVIINEFGEVGLDHDLVETTDENIVELQNGCICCTIQDDLKSTLIDLIDKMQRKEISQFNKVVIETTGLADPVPIIHTLMTSLDLHRAYSIDGVITLVDAVNGEGTYDIHEEAIKQQL
jgi:Putative GTPases (G3E family)